MDSLYDQLAKPQYYYLYDDRFIDFFEMNLPELRKNSTLKAKQLEVTDVDRARADRNFNLLCNIAKIPFDLHWVTMRVNGYKEYSEFSEKDSPLYEVDSETLAAIKIRFDESQSIT